MDGVPVYLASLSRKEPLIGRVLTTGRWSHGQLRDGIRLLRGIVAGRGDVTRERIFRMNATLCLHRALNAAEIAALPAYFHEGEACDIAGGPVAVLWENVPGRPSTKPCHKPGKRLVDIRNPDLWLPEDCGRCPPCLARAAIE